MASPHATATVRKMRAARPEESPNVAGARLKAGSSVPDYAAILLYCVTFLLEGTYGRRPQILPSRALPGTALATRLSQPWTVRRPPGRAALALHISFAGL